MKPKTERPGTKPAHVPAKKPHKAKPVFEIPQETALPAVTDWVYRSGEVATRPVNNFVSGESPHILIVASVSVFVAGIAALGLMSLASLAIAGAPVVMARSLLWR